MSGIPTLLSRRSLASVRPRALRWALFAALCIAALLALKADTLADPHYWDALGCYVWQGRFIAQHGFDLPSYHALPFIRPPLFTGLLALVMRHVSPSREVLHVLTCAIAALILPATYALVRRLGGGRGAGALAVALCAVSPSFFAQAGLVQSDLPATALSTLAWVLALQGRRGAFALCLTLGVLTKESAYFLCLPAALLFFGRLRAAGRPLLPAALAALWPPALPCAALVLWQIAHRFLSGTVFSPAYAGYLGPGNLPWALFHNFIDGGRFALWPAAALAMFAPDLAQDTPPELRRERGLTLLCAALMPIVFCAPLPRYMLPSLPLLCALAGVGVFAWLRAPAARLGASAALLLVLALGLHGRFTASDVAHLEVSLAYRRLLAVHAEAARFLQAQRPRRVLAGFPMTAVLGAPPEDGFLPAPLPLLPVSHLRPSPSGELPMAELCSADLLVQGQDESVAPALSQLDRVGALTLLRQFGGDAPPQATPLDAERDQAVRVYRVRCRPDARPDRRADLPAPSAAPAAP